MARTWAHRASCVPHGEAKDGSDITKIAEHTAKHEPVEAGTAPSWASTPGVARSMRANRRTGTRPERALRSALHRRGLRFRKDLALRLPAGRVRPDVVFTRARLAVFVDGCFWHSCPVHATHPVANAEFWFVKLERNRQRDRRDDDALADAGWQVLRLWEHELDDLGGCVDRVAGLLEGDPHAAGR